MIKIGCYNEKGVVPCECNLSKKRINNVKER